MKKLIDNLSIAKKTMLPLGIMSIVAIFLSVYLLSMMGSIDKGYQYLLDNEVSAELLATQINGDMNDISDFGYRSIAENSQDNILSMITALEKSRENLAKNFAALKKIVDVTNASASGSLDQIKMDMSASIDAAISAAKLGQSRNNAGAIALMHQQFEPGYVKMSAAMDKIQEDLSRDQSRVSAKLRHDNSVSRDAAIVILVLSILASMIAGAWISKVGIVTPIKILTAAMRKLADSDWTTDVPGTSRADEVGLMANTVEIFKKNGMEAERLRTEAEKEQKRQIARGKKIEKSVADFERIIADIVNTVSAASTELQTTAESMSATAEEASKQSSTVAAASEQATANVQTVASATEELSASVSEIQTRVSQSNEMVRRVSVQADETNKRVNGLTEAASKIGEVIQLITDIAAQTNLLALNATIEAARAGEAGKGFAVVASEVKNLAAQTAKATDEISLQIKSIQHETVSSAEAIQGITQAIVEVNKTSAAIAAAVEEQGSATQEIARNVTEAAQGTKEVSSNIVNVSEAAQRTGAAAMEVLAASGELAKNGEILKVKVDGFLQEVRSA